MVCAVEDNKQKWYDKELKSRDGDVLLLYGKNSKLKYKHTYFGEDYIWFGQENKTIFKDESWKNSPESDLFVSYLAKLVDFPAVEVRPAIAIKDNGENSAVKGIIVENYKDSDDIAITFTAGDINKANRYNTVDNIIKNLKSQKEIMSEYAYIKSVKIDPNVETDLLKLFLIDYVTCEIDRNDGNILFYAVADEENNFVLKLGKIFDNSQAFFLTDSDYEKFEDAIYKDEKFNELVDKNYSPSLLFEAKENDFLEFTSVITPKLIEKVLKNPSLTEFYQKIIEVNFDNVLGLIKKDNPDYKESKIKFEIAKKVFNHRVNLLKQEFENQKSLSSKFYINQENPQTGIEY